MTRAHATATGTHGIAIRNKQAHPSFYRQAQGLTVSTIGHGTYLGEMDEAADAGYVEAIQAAIGLGLNFLDTSLNYRHQRSEKNIGEALKKSGVAREEVILCTKAGYLVPGAMPAESIAPADMAGGMHCLSPQFLQHQLNLSLANLQVDAVDVFYLHNPETQIRFVSREELESRLRRAFELLERLADDGLSQFYGVATWEGFRKPGQLSVVQLEALARSIAGDKHRFRFIQLPLNLAMTEALSSEHESLDGRGVSPLAAAEALGITAIASASLLQARLSTGLPEAMASCFPGTRTDAQRALQFTRSTPGVRLALTGMGRADHVRENLELAALPALGPAEYEALWRSV